MWTIAPRNGGSLRSMCGIAARASRNGPRRFVARIWSNSSTSQSATSCHSVASMPALDTSASSPPSDSTDDATTASAPSAMETSPNAANASPPTARIISTVSSVRSRSRPAQTTRAPSAANRCATERPMPLDAPVTSARFPKSRPLLDKRLPILCADRIGVKRVGREHGTAGAVVFVRGQDDDSARLARRGHRDGLVDLLEREPVGDERVKIEHARDRQPRELRDVQGGYAGTEVRAEDRVLELGRRVHVEPGLASHRGLPDQHRGAAVADAGEGLLGHLRPTQSLERVVDAVAAGDRADLLDGIALTGIDHVRGAELGGEGALERHRVDGHDRERGDEAGTEHGSQADAAAAEHSHRRTGPDPGATGHAEYAGGHPAAEQAADDRVERVVDGQGTVGRHDRVGGEARDIGEMVDGVAVE